MRPVSRLWPIARLGFPEDRKKALDQNLSKYHDREGFQDPNDHIMLIDYLYYVAVDEPFEFEKDWNPVWRFIGKHMYWHPKVLEATQNHLRTLFQVPKGDPIPPVRYRAD